MANGSIPGSFCNLPLLTYLALSNNILTSNIPTSIFDISLEYFSVAFNNLSGPLLVSNTSILTPKCGYLQWRNTILLAFTFGFEQLHKLGISLLFDQPVYQNHTIRDSELNNLVNLQVLFLDDNDLTDIPLSLGNLIGLTQLDLIQTFLGHVPNELGNLKILQFFSIAKNVFTRIILFLLNFTNLAQVDLSWNNFTGTIPASLGKPVLYQFLLTGNQLSSTLDVIESLSNGKSLISFHKTNASSMTSIMYLS
jgi:Leucine-rich repeat (LRR) protein